MTYCSSDAQRAYSGFTKTDKLERCAENQFQVCTFFFFFKVYPIKNPPKLEIVCALVQSQLPQKMTFFILGLAAGQRDQGSSCYTYF